MRHRVDLTGLHFGEWEVLKFSDEENKWLCQCSCGTQKYIRTYDLTHNVTTSCGCKTIRYKDRTGEKYGELTLAEYAGNRQWKCKCSCGNEVVVQIQNLLSGNTTSCGHIQRQLASKRCKTLKTAEDISGQTIGFRKVLGYKGASKWECECTICGFIETIEKRYIASRRCAHSLNGFKNLKDQQIYDWTVLRYAGDKKWLCRCVCGTEKVIKTQRLLTGDSKSCGCRKSRNMLKSFNIPEYSIDILLDKERLIDKITELTNKNLSKPDMMQLAEEFGVDYQLIVRYITKYNLGNYIKYKSGTSYKEDEVYNFISSIYNGNIVRHFKSDKNNYELDIYIPDKKLGIEFNGNYWHSTLFKEPNYHIDKTIYFGKNGIRTIHIFEYEWDNDVKQSKIKRLLNTIINGSTTIYARSTDVVELSKEEYTDFCDKYHLQNSAKASILLGLKNNGNLVGVMSFGKPRFDNKIEYELIRECWGDNIVIGGTEKLFTYFIKNYKPKSIISYCDAAKFTGQSYLKLGFRLGEPKITNPGYVWVHQYNGSVLSRYQTQKNKLVLNNIGTEDETEDEIMSRYEYMKVHDCGNFKFIWRETYGS